MAMLDASILLQGRSPNILGSMGAGMQLRQQRDEIDRANVLAAFMQQNGAGVMRGEANALAGFAAIDPMAAIDVQGSLLGQQATSLGMDATRQGMDLAGQRMDMDREQVRMQVEEMARGRSAEERAQLADEQERVLTGATFAYQQGPEALAAFLGQNGIDPAEMPYETFPAEAAMAGVASEFLRGAMPADPREMIELEMLGLERDAMLRPAGPGYRPATPEEAAAYGASAGQFNTATNEFDPINPPSGMSLSTNPDGTMTMTQGPGGGRPLTESEGRNTGFALRMEQSNAIINQLESEGTSLRARALGALPGNIGNFAQSPEYQQFDQAKRDFATAVLRRESGAVISDAEFANVDLQYFPQPGDSPEVIAQKRLNRQTAIDGVRIGSGSGTAQVDAIRDAPVVDAPVDVPAANQPDVATIPPAAILAMPQGEFSDYVAALTEEQYNALPPEVREALMERASR